MAKRELKQSKLIIPNNTKIFFFKIGSLLISIKLIISDTTAPLARGCPLKEKDQNPSKPLLLKFASKPISGKKQAPCTLSIIAIIHSATK